VSLGLGIAGVASIPLFALASTFASCSDVKQDSSVPPQSDIDTTAPKVIAMPDDYPNVATKCAGFAHKRVWVTTHVKTDTPPTITDDPECP
jgi:hypothetical protein